MEFLKYFGWIISVILLIILLSLNQCGRNNIINNSSDTSISYIKGKDSLKIDTFLIYKDKYVPKIVYKNKFIPVTKLDSQIVLLDSNYNKINVYNDTISDSINSNIKVYILDTIQGKIINRSVKINFEQKNILRVDTVKTVITNTIIKEEKNNPFSFGISTGLGYTPVGVQPYIGVGINLTLIKFKRK